MDTNLDEVKNDETIKTSDNEIPESPEKNSGENLSEEKVRQLIKDSLGEFMDRFQQAPEHIQTEKDQEKEPDAHIEEWVI